MELAEELEVPGEECSERMVVPWAMQELELKEWLALMWVAPREGASLEERSVGLAAGGRHDGDPGKIRRKSEARTFPLCLDGSSDYRSRAFEKVQR